MIEILFRAHQGLGWLLLASTALSVVVAIAGAASGTKKAVPVAKGLARGVEGITGGLVFVLGLGLWLGRYPLTSTFLWIGVVAVIVQQVLITRAIKPNLIAMAAGIGSKKLWVGLAIAHNLLIFLGFIAMVGRW